MAYSDRARELRQCQGTRKDGTPCTLFAAWGDPSRLCGPHGGRRRTKPVCTCGAYQWPHRPGGGLCCYPDAPTRIALKPAGSHTWGKMKGGVSHPFGSLARAIRRKYLPPDKLSNLPR